MHSSEQAHARGLSMMVIYTGWHQMLALYDLLETGNLRAGFQVEVSHWK